jgi:hypothetical protein
MEMARQVFSDQKERTSEEVREAIRAKFQLEPAESLTQMLYKRSRSKSQFYRTKDGKYGLLAWRQSPKPK